MSGLAGCKCANEDKHKPASYCGSGRLAGLYELDKWHDTRVDSLTNHKQAVGKGRGCFDCADISLVKKKPNRCVFCVGRGK